MPTNNGENNGGFVVTGGQLDNSTPVVKPPTGLRGNVQREGLRTELPSEANTPQPVSTFGGNPTQTPTGNPPFPTINSGEANAIQAMVDASQVFKNFQQLLMESQLDKKIKAEVFKLALNLVTQPIISPVGPCAPPPGAITTVSQLAVSVGVDAASLPQLPTGGEQQKPTVEVSQEMMDKLWNSLEPVIIEMIRRICLGANETDAGQAIAASALRYSRNVYGRRSKPEVK